MEEQMRHFIKMALMFVITTLFSVSLVAATGDGAEFYIKKPQSKSSKKIKNKDQEELALKQKRSIAQLRNKNKKAQKIEKTTHRKNTNKKYWAVECHQGFIKDSYVYCARKVASVKNAKKLKSKKIAKTFVSKKI